MTTQKQTIELPKAAFKFTKAKDAYKVSIAPIKFPEVSELLNVPVTTLESFKTVLPTNDVQAANDALKAHLASETSETKAPKANKKKDAMPTLQAPPLVKELKFIETILNYSIHHSANSYQASETNMKAYKKLCKFVAAKSVPEYVERETVAESEKAYNDFLADVDAMLERPKKSEDDDKAIRSSDTVLYNPKTKMYLEILRVTPLHIVTIVKSASADTIQSDDEKYYRDDVYPVSFAELKDFEVRHIVQAVKTLK